MDKEFIKSPLNYTGGKYKLLPQILPLFPNKINTFVDLFTGGGNIFVNVNANRLIANDNNECIIEIFKEWQKRDINDIIEEIEEIVDLYSLTLENEWGYKKLRDDYNKSVKEDANYCFSLPIMLFVLICFSFNHQFRFNSNGEFNMPFGRNRSKWNNNIRKNLKDFHQSIIDKNVVFTNKDFRGLKIDKLSKDDFVYCDPPYLITCATYNEKNAWNVECERDLLNLLDSLNNGGIRFALSNVFSIKENKTTY